MPLGLARIDHALINVRVKDFYAYRACLCKALMLVLKEILSSPPMAWDLSPIAVERAVDKLA